MQTICLCFLLIYTFIIQFVTEYLYVELIERSIFKHMSLIVLGVILLIIIMILGFRFKYKGPLNIIYKWNLSLWLDINGQYPLNISRLYS